MADHQVTVDQSIKFKFDNAVPTSNVGVSTNLKRAKTAAERQREFRARKKAECEKRRQSSVTDVNMNSMSDVAAIECDNCSSKEDESSPNIKKYKTAAEYQREYRIRKKAECEKRRKSSVTDVNSKSDVSSNTIDNCSTSKVGFPMIMKKYKTAAEYQREYRIRKKAECEKRRKSTGGNVNSISDITAFINEIECPPIIKKRKTPAEYQRAYRIRKKAECERRRKSSVTGVNENSISDFAAISSDDCSTSEVEFRPDIRKYKTAAEFQRENRIRKTALHLETNTAPNIPDSDTGTTATTLATVTKPRLITRSVTKVRPIDMTLNMECIDDPLTETQLMSRVKLKENYDRVISNIEEIVKTYDAQLLTQAGSVSAYQYTLPQPTTPTIIKSTQLNANQNKSHPIKLNVVNNTSTPTGNIQLVMDPRMGVILSAVNQQQTSPAIINNQQPKTTLTSADGTPFARPTRQNTVRKVLQVHQPDIIEEPIPPQTPTLRVRQKPTTPTNTITNSSNTTTQQNMTNTIKLKPTPRQTSTNKPRPTEQTSIGGISVGTKNTSSDVIDESKKNLPDGREIAFNKLNGGRTFPSLVVIAKPHLRTKDIPPNLAAKERNELDAKVKSVLMFSATRFAEWLIQQGLVRSEQYCDQHTGYQPKLKLGMYSDSGTFPYSGGYVWVSTCCVDRFVSVFSGSIFQGAPHTPSVLLKLIYHWSCQTNVQNVVSWVKVSNIYVKNYYTNLRSICTAAVWDKSQLMGGKGWSIQVGVISLGTTSQDGNLRQVKVEVLGILNPETGQIRLRACDPLPDPERSVNKRRFNNILQPLKDWVHKDSKIITDFTVDRTTLQELGFNNVSQSAYSDQNARSGRSNFQIMDYLRKIVPRMFQNTLSLLSRQMIQQFLDELVWREMFGNTASRAFQNIILHIAEQTRSSISDSLLDRLAKIAANPFQNWSYSTNGFLDNPGPTSVTNKDAVPPLSALTETTNSEQPLLAVKSQASTRKSRKRGAAMIASSPEPEAKRVKSPDHSKSKESVRNDQVPLHEFYYSTAEGDKVSAFKEEKRNVNFNCFLCSATMKSNTEVMEHMIRHVPPRVPGQTESHVCRYCCAAFSSKHQMVIHVTEAHSTFGNSDGDMVGCGICEQKFGNSKFLVAHMSTTHLPSEMPYRCESCGYRTSSHKDAVDHFYKVHEMGEYLQCPYCLKVMHYYIDGGSAISSNITAYLVHMQRHVVRREQGRGNKCSRCCLWFNQKSSLKLHQAEMHISWFGAKETPSITMEKSIMISKSRHQLKRVEIDSLAPELPEDEKLKKWSSGPITINATSHNNLHLRCQECEEDIDEEEHYPGEQRCTQCRYVTCCWRAFKEHQQQIHNERPMTSLVVPSPLINIPLEQKMRCRCGFSTKNGNLLASHFVKCWHSKKTATGRQSSSGMLDSLGLVPKNST